MSLPVLALTAGEPAGVGPDLCIALSHQELPCRLSILGDIDVLRDRAAQLDLRVNFITSDAVPAHQPGALHVRHIPVAAPVTPGVLDAGNSAHVLSLLDAALAGCMNGAYHAMVTAPVHKGIINDAGFAFTGHTEYLADHSNTQQVVMMLAGGDLRVALATTHLPLREVADAITPQLLDNVIRILHDDLHHKFGIALPRIVVAGLNPHAGESGHLGREEIEIIEPVLERLRAQGMNLVGPLPADTLFSRIRHDPCDAVLAMYHDQGLPVLKYASFGAGVNITLGLPFIRTSVDHGTALDLAGSGRAEIGSLLKAIEMAIDMATWGGQRITAPPHLPMHTPRKRFGQNFLIDDGIIHAIVHAIHPQPGETVVEIGPGLGALTQPLLDCLPHLHAVELDRDIVARLQKTWPADRLTLHSCDALKFDFGALGHDLRIIGNLPYNISTPLLFHLLEFSAHIRDLHFMLQKEVVERMVAEPSTNDYGRLTIMLQRRFHLEWLLDVPPTAFNPPPKVNSAVVRLIPKKPDEIMPLNEHLFARVVAAAFSQRRKTLKNTLGSLLTADDFSAIGIDSSKRAETLSVADYEAITRHLSN